MNRSIAIAFFLIIHLYPLLSQSNSIEEESIDSIIIWMKDNIVQDSNDFHQIALRTISKAQQEGDFNKLGELHQHLASWHGFHGLTHKDSLLFHDYKALDYFERIENKPAIAKVLGALSIDLLNGGDFEESQKVTFRALDLYTELNDDGGIANSHRSLSYLFFALNEYEKSITYALQAYDYYKSVLDYNRMSYSLLSLIEAYNSSGQLEKAQDAAQECIDIVNDKIPHQVFVLARAYGFKGDVSLKQGKLEQAFRESKKAYDTARKEVGDHRAASYRSGIGFALKEQGECEKALLHFEAAIMSMEEQGINELISPLYKTTSDCYQQLGRSSEALLYYKKYADNVISISEDEIANLKTEAVIKYETGKKDEALSNQEAEIERRKQTQYIYIGIMILMATLLASLFYLFTRNKKITEALKVKIDENNMLMKEIHHRVKNNLQLLSSLLSIQYDEEDDDLISDALQVSKNRVESMGLIHQKLYTRDNLTSVNMQDYVDELCQQLEDSFSGSGRSITINDDVAIEKVDVETAIPLGLIINELITNSIKYAFENSKSGLIKVKLWEEDGENLRLIVSDDGSAGDYDSLTKKSTKFGSSLVEVLCKKLKGTIDINREEGYSTSMIFERYNLS